MQSLNGCFASGPTAKAQPWGSPVPGGGRESLGEGRLCLSGGGLGWRSSGQAGQPQLHGPRWDVPMSGEGAAEVLAEALSMISGRPWRTGEVPGSWSKAKVTAVFRKGKEEDSGSCRLPAWPASLER